MARLLPIHDTGRIASRGPTPEWEGTIMRSQFATGAALLTAVLFAAPLSASAADTVNKAEDKVKDTTHEVKDAVSDSWLTSKTKIALFAERRVWGVHGRDRDT